MEYNIIILINNNGMRSEIMRNILMSCLVLFLFGCDKEVNLDNDKLNNSQKEIEVKEQIVDKEELDIKKIYGIN